MLGDELNDERCSIETHTAASECIVFRG